METFSALLALCAGNSPVYGEFPSQRPVTRSFDVFFDLCLNKRLSKQSWGWWFETPSCPLCCHCNAYNEFQNYTFLKLLPHLPVVSELKCDKADGKLIEQSHKSHNVPVPYPTMHHSEQKCAYFCSEWCIVGYQTGALWDLWDSSTTQLTFLSWERSDIQSRSDSLLLITNQLLHFDLSLSMVSKRILCCSTLETQPPSRVWLTTNRNNKTQSHI